MIDIYTEKSDSKDWIFHNDLYFNLNTGNEEMSQKEIDFCNENNRTKGSTTVTAATGTDTTEAEPAFGEKSICTASGNGTAGSAGRLCLRKNAHG